MDILEAKRIWADVKTELRTVLPDHAYTWISETDVTGCEGNMFNIITVMALAPQVIRQTYYKKITDTFKKVTGKDYDFSLIYDEEFY